MKNSFIYRHLLNKKINRSSMASPEHSGSFTDTLDNKLRDINTSFQHNFHLQDILLDVTRTKRTLRSNEIKQYYHLFTYNKAESLIFSKTARQQEITPNDSTPQTKEALLNLKRLYCRLIEKIMVKVSYFLINRRTLSFMANQAIELLKKCQMLTRRVDFLRDTGNINEVISWIYAQNQQIQQKIIDELINKGFIISADEFYRINGIDLDNREYFQGSHEGCTEPQEGALSPMEGVPRKVKKFEINMQRQVQKRLMKQSYSKKAVDNIPPKQIKWVDIQDKYRELLISLDDMINHSGQVIQEEKEDKEQSQFEKQSISSQSSEKAEYAPEIQDQALQQQTKVREPPQRFFRSFKHKGTLQLPTPLSRIDLNKDFISEREKSQETYRSDANTDAYRKQSSVSQNSISQIPTRKPYPSGTVPFFSKSFLNTLKTIQKMNLRDSTNRLGIKRMSEQLIIFHRQEESQKEGNEYLMKVTIKNAAHKQTGSNSIRKLLKIYRTKKQSQQTETINKSIIHSKSQISANQKEKNHISSRHKPSKFYKQRSVINNPLQEQSFPIIGIKEYKQKQERWVRQRASQQWLSSQISQTLQNLKNAAEHADLQKQAQERLNTIESRPRFSITPRTSVMVMQSRLLGRYTHNPFSRCKEENGQAANSPMSPKRQFRLEDESIFTNKGIIRSDSHPSGTVTPLGSPRVIPTDQLRQNTIDTPRRVEVYDRVRRVILR